MTRVTASILAAVGALLLLLGLVVNPPVRAQDAEEGSVERGEKLYQASCATCHGPRGKGVDGWPAIAGSGEAAADYQLRTGRMPFAQERGTQAQPKPVAYDEQEIRDLVAFVASLGGGPAIREYEISEELVPRGHQLFSLNCAPCHGAGGNGGAVGGGAIAWPLNESPPRIVSDAMAHGPGQMPVFDLPQEDFDATITYVEYLRTAESPGGFAIGGIGPVPEGFVAWLLGMGLLSVVVVLVGREWGSRKGRS